jgi:hypothetical protein
MRRRSRGSSASIVRPRCPMFTLDPALESHINTPYVKNSRQTRARWAVVSRSNIAQLAGVSRFCTTLVQALGGSVGVVFRVWRGPGAQFGASILYIWFAFVASLVRAQRESGASLVRVWVRVWDEQGRAWSGWSDSGVSFVAGLVRVTGTNVQRVCHVPRANLARV